MSTIITYGTFDLFHVGHLRLLKRLKDMGDSLIVGVSTDEFNELKGKKTVISFEQRSEIVSSVRYVDMVIAEKCWEQKVDDIKKHNISIFGIGEDWRGKFDFLTEYCDVVYLQRTDGISSSSLKSLMTTFNNTHTDELKKALDIITNIVTKFE